MEEKGRRKTYVCVMRVFEKLILFNLFNLNFIFLLKFIFLFKFYFLTTKILTHV
jgi:hypothetical protein